MEPSLPQLILPIKLERSPERLTSLGGLVVLEELARAAGVWEKVDRVLKGPQSGRGDQPHEFVQPLVWMLHAGGRRLEDLGELRGQDERQEPEEVILDVDATEIEAEKQEAQWTYHKVKGYMPMLGYVNGVCVGQEFREGHQSPSAGIVEFAQECEGVLPEGKRIYFRSDSAAYQAAVINRYSPPGRSFTITADLDVAVKREIKNLSETAWQPHRTADGLATDRQIAETVHTMNGTERAFRLLVLRWPNPQPNLFEAERRSEEHTSELQSRLHLVCRLLLEKKKNKKSNKKQ